MREALLDERAPVDVDIDVEASLAQFKHNHTDLFPAQPEGAAAVVVKLHDKQDQCAHPRHGAFKPSAWGRTALVSIGVLAVIVMVTFAANPVFFQPVTDLGDRVVRFISWGPSGGLELPENVDKYSSLRQALDATGAEDAQAPTWVPQDLGLSDIRVVETDEESGEKSYWAMFLGDDRDLLFHIELKLQGEESYFDEKDNGQNQIFIWDNASYNIVSNMGTIQIKWESGKYIYAMFGALSEQEYTCVIKSLR